MADLDERNIYGCDRIMVGSWDQWQKLQATGYLDGRQHLHSHAIRFPQGYPVGTRWASHLTGYVPIGAFQLWHSSRDLWRGVRIRPYPKRHNEACRTDIQHGLQWDRRHRVLLPEVIAVHLESEPAAMGTNWKGRKTKRFGPPREQSQEASPS